MYYRSQIKNNRKLYAVILLVQPHGCKKYKKTILKSRECLSAVHQSTKGVALVLSVGPISFCIKYKILIVNSLKYNFLYSNSVNFRRNGQL